MSAPAVANARGRRRDRATRARGESRLAWLLVAPAALVIAAFVYYPLGFGFDLSLRSVVFGSGIPDRYVGLRNYSTIVRSADTATAAWHTLAYVGCAIGLELVGGIAVALVLNRPFRGRGLVLAALILPWALPSVVSGVLWSRIFNPDGGVLDTVLLDLHVIQAPRVWMASTGWAVVLITLVHVWGMLPLTSLIFLAGLQSIPDSLYAAASVDGAGSTRQFRHVTLPLLRPSIGVALTVGTVAAMAIFDEIYVLNGTALNTRSTMMEIYQTTFQQLDFGHGTALAFVLTTLSAVVGIAYVWSLRRIDH